MRKPLYADNSRAKPTIFFRKKNSFALFFLFGNFKGNPSFEVLGYIEYMIMQKY